MELFENSKIETEISHIRNLYYVLTFFKYKYTEGNFDSYVGYWAWFLLLGIEVWDDGNTNNRDG